MQKKRLDISIDSNIAREMREYSLRKCGNSRSLSQMIEDLWRDRRESLDDEEIKQSEINTIIDVKSGVKKIR
jgi:hypothetical protein